MRTLMTGLAFPEGPRWHEDRFWFSDMHADEVISVDPTGGDRRVEAVVDHQPSGLGWLPDGRLLIVSMTDRRVLRREADGRLVEHANLWALAPFHCNDAVVDAHGRMYVGNFGFDLHGNNPLATTTNLIVVEPDGKARVAAEDLAFPNGTVISPDGATLIVGESGAGRLTAFAIDANGDLSHRRVWAQLPEGCVPDGICLDASGAIWSACPRCNRVLRVAEGGTILDDRQVAEGDQAYACMLGGTTLYVCAASSSRREECRDTRSGSIVVFDVAVAGAGRP